MRCFSDGIRGGHLYSSLCRDGRQFAALNGSHSTEELSGEPDSYLDDTPDSQTVSSVSSQTSDEGKPWKPTSKELIQLLVEEFGALATEDEPEEIIFETDAGLFLDVAIVVCNRTQRSCGLRGLTDPMSDFHRASFT